MGIRFHCPNGHRLNVKSFLAGNRGICPECNARFLIPFTSGVKAELLLETEVTTVPTESLPAAEEVESLGTGTSIATDLWHVRSSGGVQSGPATTSLLKTWIQEGRVSQDSWVWRAGWLDWQRASDVFPELGGSQNTGKTSENTSRLVLEEQKSKSISSDLDDQWPLKSEIAATRLRMRQVRRQQSRTLSWALLLLIGVFVLALLVGLWRRG